MSQTFIPGYLSEIVLGPADEFDLTLTGNVLSLDLSKGINAKPVFGQQWRNSVGGQITGAISAGGHLSVENAAYWIAIIETVGVLSFRIYAGEEGGAIDAGEYSGSVIASSISITSDAEGEWEWTMDAETDGPVAFTPPTP